MTVISYEQAILEQVRQLNEEQQRQVLAFTRTLNRPKGVSGKEFLEGTKNIHIEPDDLVLMQAAITNMR